MTTEDPTLPGASDGGLRRAFDRALALQAAGDLERAVMAWRAMLIQDPDYIPALNNLGVALRRLGRIAEAEAVLQAGVERDPNRPELLVSLGQVYSEWGRRDAARMALERACALAPLDAPPHNALGRLDWEEGRLMEAAGHYTAALLADPKHLPSLIALGDLELERGSLTEAAGHFRKAAEIAPGDQAVSARLADLLLLAGDYEAGFRERGRGLRLSADEKAGPPPWEGGPLEDRRLLVTCDGGYRETLLLVRLLKALPRSSVHLVCRPELFEIMNGCGWLENVYRSQDEAPDCDVCCPLGLIPGLIGVREDDIPVAPPYLRPDPAALAPWRRRLPEGSLPVGIAWDSGDHAMALEDFAPLAALDGVSLVSLQKGPARRDIDRVDFPVHDFDDILDEGLSAFTDSAALLSCLPLSVLVEHPLAHLAGALDRPGFVLLRAAPEWWWGLESDQTPWYPGLTLVRPEGTGRPGRAMVERVAGHIRSLRERLRR